MSDEIPTFAIVGAVNHGKSSVVSALSENDQVRVSAMPGETVGCQLFWLLDLFRFYDTPGFQNPIEALGELGAADRAAEPLQVFREFIARHRGESAFEAECLLFGPIVEGAGILYVVDGSEPLLELHKAEMEILRLTAAPRLAVINRTSDDDHVRDWRRRLGQHFNAVREFNAHRATFADRVELLESLAGIEQGWKPKLMRAVAIFREEHEQRIAECAELIVEEIISCLRHRESTTAPADLPARRATIGEELKTRYMRAVAAIEVRAHARMIALFRHHFVKAGGNAERLFANDLFSEESWKMFGLEEKQLIAAGAVTGAVAGATTDVLTAGHTLFLGTVIGTALGAGGAFVLGKRRPELSVNLTGATLPAGLGRWLRHKLPVGGSALAVGPYGALNFPWILLDRAIGVFAYVSNRSHARRDEITLDTPALHDALEAHGLTSARLDDATRKIFERHFAAIRREKLDRKGRAELCELVRTRLAAVSATPLPFEALAGK